MIPVPLQCCPWHLSPRRSCCTCQHGCCMGRKKIGWFSKKKFLPYSTLWFSKRELGNLSIIFHIVAFFKNNLSAQSFASCTPTFRRPPRSHLLPTYNKTWRIILSCVIYIVADTGSGGWSWWEKSESKNEQTRFLISFIAL